MEEISRGKNKHTKLPLKFVQKQYFSKKETHFRVILVE